MKVDLKEVCIGWDVGGTGLVRSPVRRLVISCSGSAARDLT